MYHCEECIWEGKVLKEYTDLSKKREVNFYSGCPICSSDNISIIDEPKNNIKTLILQAKRHLRGLEKTLERLEKGI